MNESLETAPQTLELLCGLVRHKKDIIDGEHSTHPDQVPRSLPAECSYHQVPTAMNPQIVSRVLYVCFKMAGDIRQIQYLTM